MVRGQTRGICWGQILLILRHRLRHGWIAAPPQKFVGAQIVCSSRMHTHTCVSGYAPPSRRRVDSSLHKQRYRMAGGCWLLEAGGNSRGSARRVNQQWRQR